MSSRLAIQIGGMAALTITALLAGPGQTPGSNPLGAGSDVVAAGETVYRASCESCHGLGAVGDRERGAPPLNTTRGFAQGNSPAQLFGTVRNGVPGTEMAAYPALTDDQIWQVVAYIHSLQGAPTTQSAAGRAVGAPAPAAPPVQGAGPAAAAAPPPPPAVAPQVVAAGEALFYGAKAGCATCHEVNGRGGPIAPDLSAAGLLGSDAIRQKILNPNTPVAGAGAARGGGGGRGGRAGGPPVTVIARMPDGRQIRGIRRNEDTFSLQMMDANGQLHLLDKTKLSSVTVDTRSLMPDDFGKRLTAGEVSDLVGFLSVQMARDHAKTAAQPMTAAGLTYERLVASAQEPQNWPTYWGSYQAHHYSALKQITSANVQRLRPAWSFPLFTGVNITGRGYVAGSILQGTPLVVDGVMYATGSGNPTTVAALDARTGRQIWRWSRDQRFINPNQINPFSRGVAILNQRIYIGTLDAFLICLDARTGRQLWEVPVADTMEGYTISSPPLVVKDKVLVGTSGGEYATRGRLDAFDAASGKHAWRFYTIPGPGEPGHDTWKGDSWQTGGAPTWLTGSYDPELNTVYWAVGNPAAQIDRSVRGDGDNLYSDSVVALDPDTGKLKWHFQFTPNDGHDWDSAQAMVLVDRVWRGQPRKLLLHADRNSHFYVLDRITGQFLSGTPFVYQNWNQGFDESGRPRPFPNSNSSPEGTYLIYPSLGGGTNFQAPSYSALTGWFYMSYQEAGQQFSSAPAPVTRGATYIGRGRATTPAGRGANDPLPNSGIKAFDPQTGKTVWQFPTFQGSLTNGVLATAGNVLFASIPDGNVVALDSKTGRHLWHYQTNSAHAASPMSYMVDGRQYVAMSAGNMIVAFSLAE